MAVPDADPDATRLDDAFAAAMDAPPKPREPKAPADVDPDAPHGRDPESGEPLAPHGYTKAGRPRLSPAGRPAKDDKPRTGTAAAEPAAAAAGPLAIRTDYTAGLTETADGAWFCLSGLGMAGGKLPLIGKMIPEAKLSAQAAVFRSEQSKLVAAVNIAAQHNAKAQAFAESCANGNATWVLMCAFMALPFLAASSAIWQGDDALKAREMPSLAELGKHNEAELDKFMANLASQFEEAADTAGQETA